MAELDKRLKVTIDFVFKNTDDYLRFMQNLADADEDKFPFRRSIVKDKQWI